MGTHESQPGAGEQPQAATQASRHDPVYDRLHDSPDFAALRKAYRGFVIPATVAFLAWYLLYILMSNYAGGFMNTKLVGNINVALVFGLLQFVTTFGLAFAYARFSESRLDPLARSLNDEYDATVAGTDGKRH
ncbi:MULTISPECIES: DUF485 domain-containing protein [Nocardioides]|uniref:DUF485 domain-containing protein n=1 Tax=Nocardioides kribbensis TaxID=305517 RepID=A0ABV1P2C9_9ACTN|nr:DUF485 domain-containing protein [Nocardioides sp. P86]MCM3516831.1 DUF485 domain-containing protein [Nocardioides sp. P86]